MASTLVVETGAGLPTANAYCTVAEAEAYFEDHLYATGFTGAALETQTAAIIWATRMLDDHVIWKGFKKTSDQALAWPRGGVLTREGYCIADNTMPSFLKYATAELARHLISSDLTADNDVTGFSRIKVDVIELDVDKRNQGKVIPKSVWAILRGYGRAPGRIYRLVRG